MATLSLPTLSSPSSPSPTSKKNFVSSEPSSNNTNVSSNPLYVGRFAPSPTGELHFGSLVSAVASYLDAQAHKGKWLVRIEDLDPPREITGASKAILKSLEDHHLHWDDSVLYQSTRLSAYQDSLDFLRGQQLVYECSCSRKMISELGGVYNGHCRNNRINSNTPTAIRLKVSQLPTAFNQVSDRIVFDDIFAGEQTENIKKTTGDYIVYRKDGFFSYQLAVVIDDIYQGITHVIRGSDLLEVTAQQIFLFHLFKKKPPRYGHCPIVLNQQNQKLSKQNLATPLDNKKVSLNLFRALNFLQQNPPKNLEHESAETIIHWAINHWNRFTVPCYSGLQE